MVPSGIVTVLVEQFDINEKRNLRKPVFSAYTYTSRRRPLFGLHVGKFLRAPRDAAVSSQAACQARPLDALSPGEPQGLLRDKTRPSRIPPLGSDIAERVVALINSAVWGGDK